MAAGSIVIDLLLKTGSFETDSKRAEKRLQELKKEAQQVGAVVGAAFTAVGVAAAAMVKSSIDAADEAFKAAQAAGVSTEEYTALAYAARLNGVEQETLAKALTKLNTLVAENAQELNALGISTLDASGKARTADQVLGDLADRFAAMEEGADKSALAAQLFGERFGPQLLPFLNQGREGIQALKDEAVQLGVVFDTETAQAAEAFNDNMSRIEAAVSGVANRVAAELLPGLSSASAMLVALAKDEATVSTASDVVKAAVGGLVTVLQTVAVVGSDVGFVFKSIGREIVALVAQADALGVGLADMLGGPGAIAGALARGAISGESSWKRFTAISDAVKADAERARAELDRFQSRVMGLGQPSASTTDPRLLGEVGSIAEQTRGWGGSRPSILPQSPRGERVSATRPEREFATSDRWDVVSAAQAEAAIMNEAQEAWAKYAEKVAEAEKPLATVTSQMTDMQNLSVEVGHSFSSAIQSMIVGGADAGDVFKRLAGEIVNLVIQVMVLEPLMRSLRDTMSSVPPNPFAGGGGGGLGGLIGTLISSFFGGFFADGGAPPVGKVSIVGERGPEMFVPKTSGMVVPNHVLAGAGGGSSNLTILNQTTGRIDNVEERRISARDRVLIIQETRQAIARDFYDANSGVSRSFSSNFNARRTR